MDRICLIFLIVTAVLGADRQVFNTADWWYWRSSGDPRISPDGRHVVYVDRWNDQEANAEFANLRLVSADGRENQPFTSGSWRDEAPRWSPDSSRIAWLTDRAGKFEIRVRAVPSGEETTISVGQGPGPPAWSADGKFLAYAARVSDRPAPPRWAPPSIVEYLRAPAAIQRAIFVVPVSGGTPRRISAPGADYAAPAWTLDSESLIAVRDDSEIVAVPAGGGEVRVLTHDTARFAEPLPSPEGRKIAWLATPVRRQSYSVRQLWVMNADGSRAKMLAGALDRDVTSPQWSSDGRTVYFLADDHGSTHVYAARNDGSVRQVTKQAERLRGFSLADNGRAASVRSSANAAGDVVTFTVDVVSQPVTAASPNQHLLAERSLASIEEISFPSAGRTIQGWVVKPHGFDPSKKYPLLVDIQDDPRAMYGGEIDWRSQVFAARGWVVLHINPRGTPGYGEEFGNLLRSRYPGDDYEDLMRGVDFVLAKGYIDPAKMAVSGGLLAAWTIGHTGRFHSAVARRPIVDWTLDVATKPDGGRRAAEWMGAMPWEDPAQYTQHSPLTFAANFTTPTLILAGDPDPASDELYFALRQKKVECVLVRLPEGRPADRVRELETILGWVNR